MKDRVEVIKDPLGKIEKLSGILYNWNQKAHKLVGYDRDERMVGLFAQDLKEVLPEAVRPAPFDVDSVQGMSKTGEQYLTIQYEKIVPLLVEAIKELKNQVDELKGDK